MSENWKRILAKKIEGIRALQHDLGLKIGLAQHAKLAQTQSLKFLMELTEVNHELESCYSELRHCSAKSREESQCLDRIRQLEDNRFQLLDRLNGKHIEEYNMLPVSTQGE